MKKHKISRTIQSSEDHLEVVNVLFDLGINLELEKVGLCKAVTIISELSTNLIKYAKEGSLEILIQTEDENAVIEITSKDNGPGIKDLEMAMKDHFSTRASYGVGLPSIKRLSDGFEIASGPEGTTIKVTKNLGRGNG